mgnify:CR=1 FL=1
MKNLPVGFAGAGQGKTTASAVDGGRMARDDGDRAVDVVQESAADAALVIAIGVVGLRKGMRP